MKKILLLFFLFLLLSCTSSRGALVIDYFQCSVDGYLITCNASVSVSTSENLTEYRWGIDGSYTDWITYENESFFYMFYRSRGEYRITFDIRNTTSNASASSGVVVTEGIPATSIPPVSATNETIFYSLDTSTLPEAGPDEGYLRVFGIYMSTNLIVFTTVFVLLLLLAGFFRKEKSIRVIKTKFGKIVINRRPQK